MQQLSASAAHLRVDRLASASLCWPHLELPMSKLIAMLLRLLCELHFHMRAAKSCLLFVWQKNPTNYIWKTSIKPHRQIPLTPQNLQASLVHQSWGFKCYYQCYYTIVLAVAFSVFLSRHNVVQRHKVQVRFSHGCVWRTFSNCI